MKNKNKSKIEKSQKEDQERDFWSRIDLSDDFRKEDFKAISFPNLKPSSQAVSVRIPDYIISRLKERANKLNIPYQSLMKQYIAYGALRAEEKEAISK